MRILVTGATGLLGSHLTATLLQKGYDVVAIRRETSDLSHFESITSTYNIPLTVWDNHFEFRTASLENIHSLDQAMEGIDIVVHAAAIVSFSKKDRNRLLKVNSEGTANVVNACLKAGVQKIVHVSSTGVFPPSKETVNEHFDFDPDKKHTFYGLTKHLAEMELFRGQEEGLNIAIVNPCVILGYGNWEEGSSKFFRQGKKSFPFYSTGANAFVGVQDVCEVIVRLFAPKTSGRYLCISENLSFRDLQDMIADAFGVKRPWIKVGRNLTGLAWRIAYLLQLIGIKNMITRESARSANRIQKYDASRAKEELGMVFTPIRDVVRETATLYKSQNKG